MPAIIVGWPRATGEALLYELSQRADQPEFRLSASPGARAT